MNSLKQLHIKGLGFMLALFLLPFLLQAQTRVTGPLNSPGTLGEYYNYNNGSIQLTPGFTSTPGSGQLLYLHIITTECIPISPAFSPGRNYVLTSVPRAAAYNPTASHTTCDVMQTVQYLDSLGRPIQTVQVAGSANGADVVQPMAYDAYGREAVKYLPYAAGTFDGSFKTNAIGAQLGFYTASPISPGVTPNTYPSASTGFEQSLLDRPAEQGAPGAPWQLGGHTVQIAYGVNVTGEVLFWQVTSGGASTGSTYYPAGTLTSTATTDENGNTTTQYKDLNGRVVSKKTPDGSVTSYIYDDLGNLAYVVPPIPSGTYPLSFAESDAVFLNFIYGYHYDGRKRLVEKKIPGKAWEYMVYNALDQLVATQDGNQRNFTQWQFTKYNGVAQVIQTGMIGTPITRPDLQSFVNSYTSFWETAQNAGNGYTNNAWPQASVQTLTLNYYDGYSLIPGLPAAYSAPAGVSNMTRGLLTASKTSVVAIYDSLWTVHYYDGLGRIAQSYAQHYLGGHSSYSTGNYDKVANTYNFSNQVTATARQHYTTAGGLALTIGNTYTYDHVGRKLQTYQQINSGLNVLLSQLAYNEVGQLMSKRLHSENSGAGFLQNVAYAYNQRGWLSSSGSSLFNLDLRYDLPDAATAKFNGDISEMHYTGQHSGTRVFDYTYDNLDRLTYANSNAAGLDETIGYNTLGNITGLTRSGTGYGALTYGYTGNQLTGVSGSGFTTRSYAYDANGNANGDGVSKTITYNVLNLPFYINQSGSVITEMDYDAGGTKLRTGSNADSTFDYISGIVYRNGAIAYVQTEEGRAINEGGSYAYQYDLKDQLGNNRISFDKDPATGNAREVQEDEYYAFGLRSNLFGINNGNRYLYNGKEIQTDLTNQYDYGARFYDPVIGRWTTPDPMAEINRRYSPYNYVKNNPLRFIDPDGMYEVDAGYGIKVQSSGLNYSLFGGLDDLHTNQKSDDVAAPIAPVSSIINTDGGGVNLAMSDEERDLKIDDENPTPQDVRNSIVRIAKNYLGRTDWAYNKAKGNFPAGCNKCNLFVYDVLNKAGASPGLPHYGGTDPPTAADWANPFVKIPGWVVLTGKQTPMPGDVIAVAENYSDATGHVGIVVGHNLTSSFSSLTQQVTQNDWGFRNDNGGFVFIRRYVGQ